MYRELIQESLNYIEDNLKTEISAQELCDKAGFSLFHYYRLFQSAVGMPVMQYILRRRLLHAIYEISLGKKMVDVCLDYGFETHAGFYKAFVREFGQTPTQFLKAYKVKKPYRLNIIREEHIMITHKKTTELLKNWGLEKEPVTDVIYEQTGNRNENAFYVGEKYVIKFSTNLAKITNNISISKALDKVGLLVALPVETMEGKEYVADGEVYYCLYKRIDGKQMNPGKLGTSDYAVKARFIGESVGWLDLALEEVDVLAEEADMYAGVKNWAIPQLKDKMNLDKSFVKNYEETFGELYQKLPKQIIHRDPNPGNIILSEDKWGFIDFELSERNVRVFDPCYAATAILSETYVANDVHKMEEWVEIYQEILCGYDAVVKLTEEEKKAIPYVVISNQLLALAWFAGQERYKDIYEINCKMTEWILANFEKLQVE